MRTGLYWWLLKKSLDMRRWAKGASGYVYVSGEETQFFYGPDVMPEIHEVVNRYVGQQRHVIVAYKYKTAPTNGRAEE